MTHKLTVAEARLLLDPSSATSNDLLKLTLLELMLLGVVKVHKEWRLPHPRHKRERLYTYFLKGDNYEAFQPKKHQTIFIDALEEINEEYVLPKKFFTTVLKLLGKENYRKEWLLAPMMLRKLVKYEFILNNVFKHYRLTTIGKEIKASIKQRINSVENDINQLEEHQQLNESTLQKVKALGLFSLLLSESVLERVQESLDLVSANFNFRVNQEEIERFDTFDMIEYGLDLVDYLDFSMMDSIDFYSGSFDAGLEVASGILESVGESALGDILSNIDFSS